jgi:hypothetical protein
MKIVIFVMIICALLVYAIHPYALWLLEVPKWSPDWKMTMFLVGPMNAILGSIAGFYPGMMISDFVEDWRDDNEPLNF